MASVVIRRWQIALHPAAVVSAVPKDTRNGNVHVVVEMEDQFGLLNVWRTHGSGTSASADINMVKVIEGHMNDEIVDEVNSGIPLSLANLLLSRTTRTAVCSPACHLSIQMFKNMNTVFMKNSFI